MNLAETPVVFDFDIVERFPEEICRNIFSYLTCNELLSASLVSKDWYSLIGRAPRCMEKLTFVDSYESYWCFWASDPIKQTLKRSTRKYRNFQLDLADSDSTVTSVLEDILKIRGRKWKKVELSNVCFGTASDLFGVLNCIDQSVEELKMDRVGVYEESKIESCAPTFPKLTTCTGNYAYNHATYHAIFANCTTLKKLQLTYSGDNDDTANAAKVHLLLKRNKGLKVVNIDAGFGSQLLHTDISEGLQFQLESLSINCLGFNENQRSNLAKILRSQLSSLKSLSVRGWIGVEATKMIFHMPNLTRLKLDSFDNNYENIDLKTIEFHRNPKITDLFLKVACAEVEMLRVFFPLLPSVKRLELWTVDDEILDLIATNFPDLESLSTFWFTKADVSGKDILKNLKKLSVRGCESISLPDSGHHVPATPSLYNFGRVVDEMKETNLQNHLNSFVYCGDREMTMREMLQEMKSKCKTRDESESE